MSQKKQLLHEVLQEDQEPFHLKNYMQARSCWQPKPKPCPTTHPRKQNPIRKSKCFFALTSSPADPRKSPCVTSQGNGAVVLHVPAKTASLLLEAALRIQKQNGNAGSGARFGLFGSLLKRLTLRNSKKVKGVITSSPPLTSTVWSGITKEKSSPDVDFFPISPCKDSDDRENIGEVIDKSYCVTQFCESPFSFALSRSPPSSELSSPARRNTECQVHQEKYEEEKNVEEEKEQCSPVSTLDLPFEDGDGDDEEDGPCDDDRTDEDDGFDLECSYAMVQRAKKQLLQKLRKFEKLAGLDPVELERRMMGQDDPHCDDDDVSGSEEEAEHGEERSALWDAEKNERVCKRLVSEVIDEEGTNASFYADGELMTKRVCKRFESWKDVECNTIDMMVEMDFKGDLDQWKICHKQVEDAVLQIELGIFGLLMEELAEELVVLTEIQ